MNKINTTQFVVNSNDNIMPLPLDVIKQVVKGSYDEQTDKTYMAFLQSDIYKILKPYVDEALKYEQYPGSPIYTGYIDRDTIGTIVDKAIYYAEQDNADISEIVKNIDTTQFSKNTLLRAIVQQIVLNEVFFELRPANKDEITYENLKNTMVPENDTLETETSDEIKVNNSDIMPMPMAQ